MCLLDVFNKGKTMSHIFISYSRKDSDCVLKVARQLEGKGYRVWIDVDSIPGGSQWALEIRQGIRQAKTILVFWSSSASQSDYVRQEYEIALQQKMQNPQADHRVIPVILEPPSKAPLPDDLSDLHYVPLLTCSKDEIDQLVAEIAKDTTLKWRRPLPFDRNKTLGDQADTSRPLDSLADLDLVRVPFMQSVHCYVDIIGLRKASLAETLTVHPKTIQVLLQFMFGVDDQNLIRQVYEAIQRVNQERADRNKSPIPFFLLHITGPKSGTTYTLGDGPTGFWRGQWLDATNTSYEAIYHLVGLGGATIQLFNAVTASQNFALGLRFFKHWHFELFHRSNQDKQYRLVLDTDDLNLQQ